MITKNIGNLIELSSESGYIHKIGTETYFKKGIIFPTDTEDMFEEVNELPKYTRQEYEDKVKELIKCKYSIEDELAIQRKAFNATITPSTLSEDNINAIIDEFTEYSSFVESCKVRAVEILNNKENG